MSKVYIYYQDMIRMKLIHSSDVNDDSLLTSVSCRDIVNAYETFCIRTTNPDTVHLETCKYFKQIAYNACKVD